MLRRSFFALGAIGIVLAWVCLVALRYVLGGKPAACRYIDATMHPCG